MVPLHGAAAWHLDDGGQRSRLRERRNAREGGCGSAHKLSGCLRVAAGFVRCGAVKAYALGEGPLDATRRSAGESLGAGRGGEAAQ